MLVGVLTTIFAFVVLNKLSKSVRWFAYMMMSIAWWALTYGLELSSGTFEFQTFWLKMEFFGIVSLPVFWTLFVLSFLDKQEWLNPLNVLAIVSIPFCTLALVWTNDYHSFYYLDVSQNTLQTPSMLLLVPGPWYIVFITYFYLLLLGGSCLLLFNYSKLGELYRSQITIVLAATTLPWLVNIIRLLTMQENTLAIDHTPMAFTFTALISGYGLWQYRLLDLVPIARDKVMQSMQDAVLILSRDYRVVDSNLEAQRLFCFTESELMGQPANALLNGYRFEGKSGTDETISIWKPNKEDIYELRFKNIHWKGELKGKLLLFRDVTEQQQTQQMLKKQTGELESLNQLKTKLFSVISHDLRGSLGSVTQIARMGTSGKLSDEQLKDLMPDFSDQLERTSELMENLLNWSKSQLHGESFKTEDFDVTELIANKQRLFQNKLSAKNIRMNIKTHKSAYAFADEAMVDIVVRNLISNAIKFCDQGGQITLDHYYHAEELVVSVEDNGRGISQEEKDKIFRNEHFTKPGTAHEKGTGLGLMLCKEYVEKNGGKLWFESYLGRGSTFYFSVPKGAAPDETKIRTLPGLNRTA